MIKKLKRRYLITNMLLLSSTLLVCLAVLFGFLYHSEVASSYAVMQQMMKEERIPQRQRPNGQSTPELQPTAQTDTAENLPLVHRGTFSILELDDNGNYWENKNGDDQQWWKGETQPPEQKPDDHGQNNGQDNGQNNGQNQNPWENPWGSQPWVAPPWMIPPWVPSPWADPSQWGQWAPPDWGNQNWQWTQPPEDQPHEEPSVPDDPPPAAPDDPHEPDIAETAAPEQTETQTETQTESAETETAAVPPEAAQENPPKDEAPHSDTTETETVPEQPQAAASVDDDPNDIPTPPIVPVHEGEYVPDALVATVDSEGNIESYIGNDPHTSDDEHFKTIYHAVDEVRRRGRSAGTINIGSNSYRFLYQPDASGSYRLVLLDRTLELSTLSRLLFIFVLITVLGLLAMFGISVMLANWTVTPVAVAWEKQKQFVADASHELKTPLAVISANTEVVLSNPTEYVSGQSKWLNYIQAETTRMSKLISNLLSVARMDGPQQKEPLSPLALSEAVANVCLVFEPIIYENGKTLNTVIQRNVSLRAEEDNVKQLLSILLDNAVLHSVPHAKITVALSKDAQNKIRLAVSNTAKDIPQEQLSHLFERFYRVDTEGSPNGSGLGLSIAKSIVHQMGGSLTVTSENELVTFVATFA